MKILSNVFFTLAIIIFFTSLTISFIIIQIVINKQLIIDQSTVNIFDIFIKASFALIGSSLSGFVAFLIFFLGDRKKEKEKRENEINLISKINDEYKNNIKIYKTLLESTFSDYQTEQIADLLQMEKSAIKEGLLIYYTKLDFSIFNGSIKDINEKNYIDNIQKWRKQKVIYEYLNLLLNNVNNKANVITLIELIRTEIINLTK